MEYTKDDLVEAKRQINSTLHKLNEALKTFKSKENSERYKSQITLAKRRIDAFEIANYLIENEIKLKSSAVKIQKIERNKKDYIDLLLLADEQEDMIDKYLERGEMFILEDGGVKAECVVTKENDTVYELKNIAVLPDCQKKGYGRRLIDFLFENYSDCEVLFVGTGDVPSTLEFYKKCGFKKSHRVENFFTDNYDHPIFEDGKQLVDMVYLKKERF